MRGFVAVLVVMVVGWGSTPLLAQEEERSIEERLDRIEATMRQIVAHLKADETEEKVERPRVVARALVVPSPEKTCPHCGSSRGGERGARERRWGPRFSGRWGGRPMPLFGMIDPRRRRMHHEEVFEFHFEQDLEEMELEEENGGGQAHRRTLHLVVPGPGHPRRAFERVERSEEEGEDGQRRVILRVERMGGSLEEAIEAIRRQLESEDLGEEASRGLERVLEHLERRGRSDPDDENDRDDD